ncbi:aldo/keto reductase [Paenibacillus shenyangensis]|uniref:aldo/keto reductase n=1 Tax=Paenibacillus sp. A9 TaxID=1284352 RepID=UPI00035DDB35|nr:aldo/keto reductase [Paenibacillus sp. A9]
MEKRKYGNTDMQVSVLGFGGSEIGSGISQSEVDQLLHSALDAGLNIIDTAECYGDSEELIGNALADRRDDYYLFSKCGHAAGFEAPDWDRNMLEQSIDRSLRRLQTDHLDMIHLHSCSEEVLRRGEVIEVLQRAKQQGKTRYIGYSGDSADALYAIETGVFDSLETSVNIADQEAISLTIPGARERGMGIVAKRPIANAAWTREQVEPQDYAFVYWNRLRDLNYTFLQDKDVQNSIKQALRFTLSIPGVDTMIVGTTKPNRWSENAALIADGVLSQEEFDHIRQRWFATAESEWVGQI